jgi:Domain of unknown function (DUF4232)
MKFSLTSKRFAASAVIAAAVIAAPALALASGSGHAAQNGGQAARNNGTPARCKSTAVRAWVGEPGNGTAGSTYYELELSNISKHTCTVFGYPGVSAIAQGDRQLGSAAVREDPGTSQLITLASGETAHFQLRITDVGVYSRKACDPVTAVGVQVFPPNDFNSQIVTPFVFSACKRHGPKYLGISPAVPGTGIPGYSTAG